LNGIPFADNSIFDRTYMAFGSIMNGLQQRLANVSKEEAENMIKWAWKTARAFTQEAVNEGLANSSKESGMEFHPVDTDKVVKNVKDMFEDFQ